MESIKNLDLLGLTPKEEKVLLGLQNGLNTPVLLSRETRISRPAVYAILQNLKKRGLAVSRTTDGKKYWQMGTEQEIEETLYAAKRVLLKIPAGREELRGLSDATVIIHRGKEAIRAVMLNLFSEKKNERFFWGFQGDTSTIGWNKTFTVAETNKINRYIKNNRIITEAILPEGWFEDQTKKLGVEWAKDFEGRTTRVNVLDPKYFKHGGQCWIFKDSVYLFALNEELVIEIRNSEIQRMILSIFEFMQENSPIVDANELLRKLIEANSPAVKAEPPLLKKLQARRRVGAPPRLPHQGSQLPPPRLAGRRARIWHRDFARSKFELHPAETAKITSQTRSVWRLYFCRSAGGLESERGHPASRPGRASRPERRSGATAPL